MQFIEENWRDIQRYYDNTYIKIEEEGDKLFFINSVRPSQVELVDENQESAIIYLHNKAPYNLTFTLPHKYTYQSEDRAYHIYRIPAKQYYRGIHPENTAILSLYSSWCPCQIDFLSLKAFVQKPPFISLRHALQKGLSTYKSVAISSRMAVDMKSGNVYLDIKNIGQFNWSKAEVAVHPLFIPELTKVLQYTGDLYDFKILPGKLK